MSLDYEVKYGIEAENDLKNIYIYISEELLSTSAAKNQITRLFKRIEDLSFMPERFRHVDSEFSDISILHKMPVDNFNVYYRIIEESKEVEIVRVLYYRRNFEEVMQNNLSGFVSENTDMYEKLIISEREIDRGEYQDALGALEDLRKKYGLKTDNIK